MDVQQVTQVLDFAVRAAVGTRCLILDIYHAGFEVVEKNDGSPVTAADIASSDFIRATLEPTALPFVCEEDCQFTPLQRAEMPAYWLIDPLDGTKEFVKHNDEFTVNIALMELQRPIAGVIYSPVTDTLWLGFNNKAFRCDNVSQLAPISLNAVLKHSTIVTADDDPNQPFTILVSRSHRDEQVDEYLRRNVLPTHPDANIIPLGSTLKFAMLAESKADMYVCYSKTKEWDTAAAQALLEAAGGRITAIDTGKPLSYGKVIFDNPPFVAYARRMSDKEQSN